MSKTTIEWADRAWNPSDANLKVSKGCKLSYAEFIRTRRNKLLKVKPVKKKKS